MSKLRDMTQTLVTEALRLLHRCGWPGLAGGMLLVATLTAAQVVTPAMRSEIAELAQTRRSLRLAGPDSKPQRDQREVMADFYARFPARSQLPQILVRLHQEAARQQLSATQADYRDQIEAGTPLVRVRIEVPVSGSYAGLRNWIDTLLRQQPALSLDGMELRRLDTGSTQLTARVRFQLYLRSGS
ncbi:MAG: GspMb/PilO family protein [Rhodocyclaceae bacterium]